MAAFYGRKIKKEEINIRTGYPWALSDVPARWQEAVQEWLDTH